MANKTPRYSDEISPTARRRLSMPRSKPSAPPAGAAGRVSICNGSMPSSNEYRTGDGEVRQAQRPGSTAALDIPSRGFST